jgi:hypothetical protein
MPPDLPARDAAIHPAVAACAAETTDEGKTVAVIRWLHYNAEQWITSNDSGWEAADRLTRMADEIEGGVPDGR